MILFSCETSGAICNEAFVALSQLARQAKRQGGRDGTKYGTNRASPKAFRTHHLAQISSAIVYADAETLLTYADGTMG